MKITIQKEHWIGIMMTNEISHTNHPISSQGQINVSIGNVMFVVKEAKLQRLLLVMQEQRFHAKSVLSKVEQTNAMEKSL